ncbi:Plipastatin synthase subunit D [Andreprevotia sp. IGB-42]|uniref:non-ribosomal peptide synthetase n=1 Tax=Andreprevotia sp. IGB-42 TaxID=2497473 RepID=UPI001359DD7F|nr:non-ribosomal peptide synthetase [Andreprevotia sp. IGB-42]KAF0813911.1 Plipastatin synthase subunit D [Andreprevotia sp. IGB-42]
MQAITQNDAAAKEHALKSAAYLKNLLGASWIPAAFAGMPGHAADNGVSTLALPGEVTASLQAISRGDWINIAAIMSVATQLLIHSHVASDTPLSTGISLPVEGQPPLCLLLLNEAPAAEQKLSELIKSHRTAILDALAYGFGSFNDIRRHAALERAVPLTGLHLAVGHNAAEMAQPGVVQLQLATLGTEATLVFRANGAPFPAEYRAAILDNLQHILAQLCAAPTAEAQSISLTSPRNAEHALALAQGPECDFTGTRRLEQVLEQRALDHAGKTAATDQHGSVSYAELNRQANGVAQTLIGLGVQPGQVVAVMVPRGIGMLAAIYGVLKAGAAYVPIDPNYPENRRSYILQDSGAFVLLQQGSTAAVSDAAVRCVDVAGCLAAGTDANPAVDKHADEIAYLIYTSGSTGNPKGVMIEHRSAFNRIEWMQNQFGLTADDVILQKTPVSFDVSVWELFWWPFAGASVVLLAPGAEKEPAQILATLKQHRVTHMHFVPTMLDAFLNDLELEADAIRGAALRIVFTSGEALTMHQSNRFFALIGQAQGSRLVNLYGPTEATVDVTWYECLADDAKASVPIGRPIQNTQIYIVDKHGKPTALGVPGELCIGGVNLARGYLNREELTAEKFCQLPLPDLRRVYRSGDLVRWLADGQIEYLGRIDHQVKIRGYRIELGEIESALLRCPGITDIRVIPRSREDGSRYLAAYAVTNAGYSEAAVRQQLLSNLPEFMVPPFIVEVASFPLTPNGKLDRGLLPDPYTLMAASRKVPPGNALEQMLADIWSEVLGVKDPGIHDNFFSLGGDSISFLAIISHARKAGLEISFQALFQYPTISQLAPFVGKAVAVVETEYQPFSLLSAADRASVPAGLEDAYPMTALQAGLIFQSELLRGASWYHDIQSYNLQGSFNRAAFEQAMQWMVNEHPIMRTSYQLSQHDEFVQYIHESAQLPLFIEDWRGLDAAGQTAKLEAFFEHESHYRFNWAEPGLIRVHIHILSDERFRYSLSFHDSALDGWSINLLHTRLLSYYHMARRGETPQQPLRDDFLRKYLVLERATGQDPAARAYWLGELAAFEAMPVPRPLREKRATPVIDYFDVEIESSLSQSIRALASELAVPVKTVLLACHLHVLGVICNRQRVITGYEHSGRPEELNAEQGVGLFLNSVPYQLELAQHENWRGLIGRVHAHEAEFLPHRRFPLAEMKAELGTTELMFETVFNFTHFHMLKELKALPGMDELTVKVRAETEFPLRAEFGQDAYTDEVRLSLHYYSNEFDQAQIARFAGYYKAALRQLASSPDTHYLDQSLLDAAELAQLAKLGRGAEHALPETTAIEQIRQVTRQQPQAIALQDEDFRLSFAGLEQHAAALGALLPAGQQHVVGVALPRSAAWVAAIYAIMAKGDIYLPLDLEMPDARLLELITQSGVRAIVCTPEQQQRLAALSASIPDGPGLISLAPDAASGTPAVTLARPLPQDLAYLMFTSGSTGTPKGAQLEHAGMLNHMLAKIDDLQLDASDVIAQTAPVTFDVSVWQALTGLLVGARTVVYDKAIQLDLPRFIAQLEADGVTVLEVVPSWFAVLLDFLESAPHAPRFAQLRTLVLTGEALKQEQVNRWFTLHPAIALVNAYGPTEASDDITHCILQGPVETHIVPVGRPVRNLQLHVLNNHDQPVPLGTPGEICVSGIGVGRGYINAPDKTAAAFDFDHPLARWSNGRLYRTGDLGYWLADGNLAYLGRKDEQIKVRGMRVEPGEIENVLLAMTDVRDAAVVFDGVGLTGFICGTHDIATVQTGLMRKLPLHMVPDRLLTIEALPLSRAGKVDKKALLEIAARQVKDHLTVVPLATQRQQEIASLWAAVLQLDADHIGSNSNFFNLGGNSLLAMLAAMRSGGRFSIADLFEQRTLADLAACSERAIANRDVLRPLKTAGSDLALVCFSYAAGNSINFQPVADQLQAGISLYGVEPPGNDPSTGEDFIDLVELVSRCVAELQQRGVRRIIPWGHCSGTGGAVELVRQAKAAGLEVAGAVVSGKLLRDDDTLQAQIRQNETMSDKEIVSWLVDVTGFALDQAGNANFTQHLAGAFRNDAIEANRMLIPLWQTPLPLMEQPLLCLIARNDPLTLDHAALVQNWRRFSPQLVMRELPDGGHYFIKSHATAVADLVQRALLN